MHERGSDHIRIVVTCSRENANDGARVLLRLARFSFFDGAQNSNYLCVCRYTPKSFGLIESDVFARTTYCKTQLIAGTGEQLHCLVVNCCALERQLRQCLRENMSIVAGKDIDTYGIVSQSIDESSPSCRRDVIPRKFESTQPLAKADQTIKIKDRTECHRTLLIQSASANNSAL